MGAATTVQGRFRYRDDDGNETTATWKAGVDVDWVPVVGDLDTPFRLRLEISTSGMDESSGNYVIRLSVDDGAYNPITTTSTDGVISIVSDDAGAPFDGDPTTEQMAGSGSFLAGEMDEDGATGSITIANGDDCEIEYVLQLDSANLSGGEKLEFRVYRDTTALDSYTVTPTIASAPTPPVGSIEQASFRFRKEGCTELINANGAGDWEAAVDTDVELDFLAEWGGLLFYLRIEMEEVLSAPKTVIPKIQYRINVGSWSTPRDWDWEDPGNESPPHDEVMIVNVDTNADGAATTNIISGSAKTFVAGTGEHNATAASVTLNGEHTEVQWGILVSLLSDGKAELSDGDTIDFRIVESDDTLLGGVYDFPRVTIRVPDGYIGGTSIETMQNFSFIKTPAGTLYGAIEAGEITPDIMMIKSLDGGKIWIGQDTGTDLTDNDLESWSMVYDDTNKVIHCVHVASGADYYQFATEDHTTETPDTWLTGNFQDLEASVDSVNQTAECIIRGSNVYALYADLDSTEQVFYRKKTNLTDGSWGARVSIDTSGGTADFSGVSAVLGPNSGLIHLFYTDYSNNDCFHRSLDGSDILGTIHTVETDLRTTGGQHAMTNAISWYNGSVEKAMIGFVDQSNRYLFTAIVEEDGEADTRQNASNSVDVLENPSGLNSRQPAASLGLDGNEVWAFYVDDSTFDIWRASNDDGGGWSGHTEEQDAVTAHGIRGQVFTHSSGNGGDKVFGYIWETAYDATVVRSGYTGTPQYDEYVISTGAVRRVFITHI